MERTVEVVPEAGIHARPAAEFVQTANRFGAELTVGRPDEEMVSANSMLAVTGLNVRNGETVRIVAEGDDAAEALDALEAVLTTPVAGDDGETADGEGGETP
ncbi:HPr family phosphocarrier protein [Halosimplex amylolyticum]|uniref:HPr family phosphocarrier protein n=1 Tax=Halosimplex amylolyticum TaxID=3396616 RepID=UPI003F57F278